MDFSALRELVLTITRNRAKHIAVLGNPGQEWKQTESFYDGIVKGIFTSDESAAKTLFNTNNIKDDRYRRLKNRLIRQLMNTSIFMEIEKPLYADSSKALYNSYKDFASAAMLLARGAKEAGIFLLHQLLEQTLKYEFIELSCEVTRFLTLEYERVLSDTSNYEKFNKLNKLLEDKRQYQILAQDFYNDVVSYYINHRSPNIEIHQKAKFYYNKLEPLCLTVNTSRFYFFVFSLKLIEFTSSNNFASALEKCEEFLLILQSRKVQKDNHILMLCLQKLSCLTQLKNFKESFGEQTYEKCLDHIIVGDFNWFRTLEQYTYYNLHAGRYELAFETFSKAVQHPSFASLPGTARENWVLFTGYFHLLGQLGRLDLQKIEALTATFRVAKFKNEFEHFEKDKEGMNIPVVMLPVLMSLAKGSYDEHGRSVGALEKYRQRYLDNEINRRSACFIRLLIALEQRPYDPVNAERKIQKELETLRSMPANQTKQNFAIEIIPYEDLWEMLYEPLEAPENKSARSVSRGVNQVN